MIEKEIIYIVRQNKPSRKKRNIKGNNNNNNNVKNQ